jgi:hypothetical protein
MSGSRKVGCGDFLKFLDNVQIKATRCCKFITCSRELILATDSLSSVQLLLQFVQIRLLGDDLAITDAQGLTSMIHHC